MRGRISRLQLAAAITAALLLVSACTDRSPTAPAPAAATVTKSPLDTLVIVSAPSAQLIPASGALVTGSTNAASTANVAAASVVYVSLTPHSVLGGSTAAIRNRRSGDSVVVSMADGGFDPAPIIAAVDDSLTIDIRDGTLVILTASTRVPKRRPPTIVRSEPPEGKTDVPLNTQIEVVFSEPVDPTTLAGDVRLFNGTRVVAGTVTLSASGIVADFAPESPLAPLTEYELVVGTTVRNLRGEGLDSAVHVAFTTGGTTGESPATSAASLAVSGLPTSVIVGRPVTYMLTVKDASGNIATGYTGTLHFASTDPAAKLPPNYTFVGADQGSRIFTVTFGTAGNQTITANDAASSINVGGTVSVVSVSGFAAINAGVVSSCGLTTSGVAYCWGTNDLGRLGDGSTQDKLVPVPVSGGLRFTTLMTASVQTCGLTTGGAAYCWGSNLFAALGSGTTTAPQMCYSADWADEGVGNQPCSPSPLPVAGGVRFVALSAGGSGATCGLTSDGVAYCWGYDADGELGSGTRTGCYSPSDAVALLPGTTNWPCSPTPVPVSGGLAFASLSASGFHTCGLTTGGAVYCWGSNYYGELGSRSTTNQNVPVKVPAVMRFVAISSGSYHTCALTTDGRAYCWGWNNNGQLGDGTTMDSNLPVPVAGGLRFITLSTMSWHTCGLTTSGEAYCWGQNFDGQLGDGTTTNRNVPVPVLGGLRFVALSAGHRHTCGVTTDGTYCWGANDYGQFGDGTTTSSNTPVKATGPP